MQGYRHSIYTELLRAMTASSPRPLIIDRGQRARGFNPGKRSVDDAAVTSDESVAEKWSTCCTDEVTKAMIVLETRGRTAAILPLLG